MQITRASVNVSLAFCLCLLAACAADEKNPRSGNGSAGASGAAASGNGGDGAGGFDNNQVDAAIGGGAGESGQLGDACASVRVTGQADVKPANVLVLFDQSLTMNEAWMEPGGTSSPKYLAAGKALIDAIAPIVAKVNLGGIFFPTTAAGFDICTAAVAPISMAPPQIAIAPGPDFIQRWDEHFAPPWSTLYGTPLNKALEEADIALGTGTSSNTAVVIFTDGQWTCENGSEQTTVASLFSRGIKTYVVGLPGSAGVTGLDTLAKAGGTADASCASNCFLLPDDTMQLREQISKIVVETGGFASCTFTIRGRIVNAALACSTGHVKLDDEEIACDPTDGYTVDDETHITFRGASCELLKSSAGELNAMFPCDVVVPE